MTSSSIRRVYNSLLWLGALVFSLSTGGISSAQLTVEQLIGSSVEAVGPQHEDIETAITRFRERDFAGARTLLEDAKSKDPRIPPAGVLLANMLIAANQLSLAFAELERVIKSDPRDPESYLLFGELAYQQRRFADADLAFAKSLGLLRSFSANQKRQRALSKRAYSGLAAVAEVREDWDTAKKYLAPLIKADPADASLVTRMARAVFQLGEQQSSDDAKTRSRREAYQLLRELWTKDNSLTPPEITMGRLFENAGLRANAKQMMSNVVTQDQRIETQLAVASWAMDAGELDLAQQCASNALKANAQSVEAQLVSGLVARYDSDYLSARKAFEAAHLQSPSNLAAMLSLAVVLIEQPGNERIALEYAQMSVGIYSDLAQASGREAAVTRAWILFRRSKPSEAQQAVKQALNAGTVSAERSYYAALILLQQGGNWGTAKQLLQRALESNRAFPTRPKAEQLLARLGDQQ